MPELNAQSLVNALTAQRNRAFDEAAQLAAMCQQLTEENAKLKEKADGLTDPTP
jgi:cell division protein FtsB